MHSTNSKCLFSNDQSLGHDDSYDNRYDFPEIFDNHIDDDQNSVTDVFEFSAENSDTFESCNDMKKFLTVPTSQISRLRLNHNKTNIIYDLFSDFVTHLTCLNERMVSSENGMNVSESLSCASLFVRQTLSEYRTQYKRQKVCERSETYAQPQELAVGTWYVITTH